MLIAVVDSSAVVIVLIELGHVLRTSDGASAGPFFLHAGHAARNVIAATQLHDKVPSMQTCMNCRQPAQGL